MTTEIEQDEHIDYRESSTEANEEEATVTSANVLGSVTATYRRSTTVTSSVTPAS